MTSGGWFTPGATAAYGITISRHDLLNEVEITDSNGHVTSVSFDDNGLPVSEIDPTGGNTVFHYDDFGRTVELIEPDGSTRRWEYDEQGRMIAEHLPDGSQIQAAYNEDGDLLTLIDERRLLAFGLRRTRQPAGGNGPYRRHLALSV